MRFSPRFSLKVLLLLTMLVAGYFGLSLSRQQREQRALMVITAAGGECASHRSSLFYPFWETWVVSFEGRQFTDENLQHVAPYLRHLPGLEYVQIIRTSVTDDGIRSLAGVAHFKKLDLWDNNITDRAVPNLKKMTSLSELNLAGTMISDAGARELKAMTHLRKLTLPGQSPVRAPKGTVEADLQLLGDELLAEQPIPGIVSQYTANDLSSSLHNCTVILNTTLPYSGGNRR
jgi:hypothetical protein